MIHEIGISKRWLISGVAFSYSHSRSQGHAALLVILLFCKYLCIPGFNAEIIIIFRSTQKCSEFTWTFARQFFFIYLFIYLFYEYKPLFKT